MVSPVRTYGMSHTYVWYVLYILYVRMVRPVRYVRYVCTYVKKLILDIMHFDHMLDISFCLYVCTYMYVRTRIIFSLGVQRLCLQTHKNYIWIYCLIMKLYVGM